VTRPALARLACLAALGLVGSSALAPIAATEPPRAFRAARVFPVSGAAIDDGVVLVRDGRIEAVGPASNVPAPPGHEVVGDGSGWIVPGFVDLHTHVAGRDLNDMVLPVNPDLTVLDVLVPGNELLLDALAGGVTTQLFIPGSGTNISGFGALIKPAGRTLEEMIVRHPGAMKVAQAGNPERYSGEIGTSRLGMNWNLRQALRQGREYHEAWLRYERGETPEPPARVQRHELMRGLFRRDLPILVHTQWMPVFQSTIRILRDEMDLWIVLSHAEFDSYHNAPLVRERDLFVNVGPRAYHPDFDTGQIIGLAQRYREDGVKHVSVNTDSAVVQAEELSLQAAMAVRWGFPWELALAALTSEPALAIGLGDRVGTLEPGKDADLVLWTGDPLDPRSHVLLNVTGGRLALDQRDASAPRRF
jgi:imidazolonepropionase-like amidohydrolase